MHPVPLRLVVFALVSAFTLIASGEAALAHAFLKTAEPRVGSTVHAAPTEVAITFTEEVEPRFSTIVVQDAKGRRVDKGDMHVAAGHSDQLVVDVNPLQPGTYKVIWHATAVDTHKTQGSYRFTIAP